MVKPKTMLGTYGGIRDLAILHRDVEVNPDQHSFAIEINVSN